MKTINWIRIFFGINLFISSFYVFAKGDDDWKSPESVAERKARWMYKDYLNDVFWVPAFYSKSLAFRIQNNISQTSEKDGMEFYLLSFEVKGGFVEINYPLKKSLYNQLYDYFLKNPKDGFDSFNFHPDTIKKEMSFADCPGLEKPLNDVRAYAKSSLMSYVHQAPLEKIYSLGYTDFNFGVLYQSNNIKEPPFSIMIEAKKIAESCAVNLPTVEQKRKNEEDERRKNYKGKTFDSPPLIVMHVGDKKYESFLGTFCWPINTESFCSDSFATITAKKPIHLKQGSVLSFEIPELENLENISIAIEPVNSKDISKDKHCDGHCIVWEKEINPQESTVKALQSISLNDKGEYVIVLSGLWNLYGDAEHSFYIKVE